MNESTGKYYTFLVILILLLLVPALLINLGLLPVIADEATRAVVSYEMELSGNIITPTINGEYYFNKPPLYNWLILSLYKITANHSELILRLPTVFFLLLFGFTIWQSSRKRIGSRTAFISALAFITCGRILFYDSMLGLIDMSFSLLIFLNFIVIYHFLQKEKYALLFLLSYLIAALAFLMKGLPAVVFQGLTIITALIFLKKGRKLFHPFHALGILVFLIFSGSYYFTVWKINPDTGYFSTLLTESTKRTFIEYGWWRTFLHLFSFPAEQLVQLFPWSILGLFLFQKSFYINIRKNKYLSYMGLVFLVNIPVYWISVETYPRYLFMLYPILLILIVNHYYSLPAENRFRQIVSVSVIIAGILSILAGIFYFFNYDFESEFPQTFVFILALSVSGTLLFISWKKPAIRLEMIILLLLFARIGFNLIVLPEKYTTSRQARQKEQAIHAARIAGTSVIRPHTNSPVSIETIFYIMQEQKSIIYLHQGKLIPGHYYIFDVSDYDYPGEEVVYIFETRWQNKGVRLSWINGP